MSDNKDTQKKGFFSRLFQGSNDSASSDNTEVKSNEIPTKTQLNKMKKAEIVQAASDLGLELDGTLTKAKLIEEWDSNFNKNSEEEAPVEEEASAEEVVAEAEEEAPVEEEASAEEVVAEAEEEAPVEEEASAEEVVAEAEEEAPVEEEASAEEVVAEAEEEAPVEEEASAEEVVAEAEEEAPVEEEASAEEVVAEAEEEAPVEEEASAEEVVAEAEEEAPVSPEISTKEKSSSDILKAFESKQLRTDLPSFRPGDTVAVSVKVKEGNRSRLQVFEGVVMGVKRGGINASFVVRKISSGIGVERTFQMHSPMIDSISVKRKGDVRQAKLFYLRDRSGKSARIKERLE